MKAPASNGANQPGIVPKALVIPKIVPEKLEAMSKGFTKKPVYKAPCIVMARVKRTMVALSLHPVKQIPIRQNAVPA